MIAVAGPFIERSLPHALSLSEFSGWRFGLVCQIGVRARQRHCGARCDRAVSLIRPMARTGICYSNF